MKVKKLDLAQTIGILANIGVVAGIVFLGAELKQNNENLEAQIDHQFFQNRITLASDIVRDQSLSELIAKSRFSGELTPAEQLRMSNVQRRILLNIEWEYSQYEKGRIADVPVAAWRATLANMSGSGVWDSMAAGLSESNPSFLKFMQDNVINE